MSLTPPPGTSRRRWAPRSWELWSLPADLRSYLIVTEVAAALWTVAALLTETVNRAELVRFAVLVALFAVCQQISSRIERMRIRMANSHQIDMTSVWTFAGVVVLPIGLAALVAVLISVAMAGLRLRAGTHPYRQMLTAASVTMA